MKSLGSFSFTFEADRRGKGRKEEVSLEAKQLAALVSAKRLGVLVSDTPWCLLVSDKKPSGEKRFY
jgi:hypothetical protein